MWPVFALRQITSPLSRVALAFEITRSALLHLFCSEPHRRSFQVPTPRSDTLVNHAVVDEMGIVVGTSARSKSFIHDLIQRVRGVVGGSLADYEVGSRGVAVVVSKNKAHRGTDACPAFWPCGCPPQELFANTTAEATHNAMLQAHRLGANAIIRVRLAKRNCTLL